MNVKWKGCDISQYFPKPFNSHFGDSIKVKIDTSSFALKTNLANLKTEIDKLDIDKFAPIPVDLSKLSDVVKNDVVKKLCMINWLQK